MQIKERDLFGHHYRHPYRTRDWKTRVSAPNLTRPDTRPIPVADGWAGAEMFVFTIFNSMGPDQRMHGPTGEPSLL